MQRRAEPARHNEPLAKRTFKTAEETAELGSLLPFAVIDMKVGFEPEAPSGWYRPDTEECRFRILPAGRVISTIFSEFLFRDDLANGSGEWFDERQFVIARDQLKSFGRRESRKELP